MNVLSTEKRAAVLSLLTEGNSIRSTERLTGIHRDTIMRLTVAAGEACNKLMAEAMKDLPCRDIQVDEIWGFIGKKKRNIQSIEEEATMGDAWTFVAIDRDTKAVPCYMVGKRDTETTKRFIAELGGRMANRVQISADGLRSYVEAIEQEFGADVDFGQIVKSYADSLEFSERTRRYSPLHVVSVKRTPVFGDPKEGQISTSHIERQHLTARMRNRRLTRLTNAFSKKLENFKAAVALHYTWYNFGVVHSAIKTTPAVALGIASAPWTMEHLVERIA